MRAAVRPFAPWQAVVTSPLRRCAEFATELSGELGIRSDEWPEFREMAFGDWEGRTAASILEERREELAAFWRDPMTTSPPGGETLGEVAGRVTTAWARLIKAHQGKHVLLVAHGGVIRVILAHALGMPMTNLFRIEVSYACMSRLEIHPEARVSQAVLMFHGAR